MCKFKNKYLNLQHIIAFYLLKLKEYRIMATANIITGQFVKLEQTPATIADRIVGRIIDGVAIILYTIALIYLTACLDDLNFVKTEWIIVVYIILVTLPIWTYSFLCESLLRGKTLGKFIMKTRVVMADGARPTIGALLIRWLLEVIDVYFCLVGIVPIIITCRHQRLGDLAAGTMVVKEPDMRDMHISLSEFAYARPDYTPTYNNAQRLTLAQADVIADVIARIEKTHTVDREKLFKLSSKVEKVLSLPHQEKPLSFLRTVLNDYRFYAAQII